MKMCNLFKDRYDRPSPLAGGGAKGKGGVEEGGEAGIRSNSISVKRDINAGLACAAAVSAGKEASYA